MIADSSRPTLTFVTSEPEAPFSVRIGARLPDRELWDGVPDWLLDPLLDWLTENASTAAVRQLALRLRLSLPQTDSPNTALREALAQRVLESERGRWDVLDAIDFLCRYEDDLWIPRGWTGTEPIPGTEPLTHLDYILATGGSAYHYRNGHLERRVDATGIAAFEHVATTAQDEASMYLRRAWTATYGRDPDPSRAYGDAVRAVEAVACPVLLPNDRNRTLGKAIGQLRERPGDWHLVLPGGGDARGVAPIVAALQLLWTGQRSRHAGSPDSRVQLQSEAEAALSLAVTIVQWFASEFIRRHDQPFLS